MILTTKSRYAVMAMTEMATEREESVITLLSISESQKIPHSYLEQLFTKLKRAGIVHAVRGPGGGYKLNIVPEEITIYNLIRAVEDEVTAPKCGGSKKCESSQAKCITHNLWEELENQVINYLKQVSIADILNGNVNHTQATHTHLADKIYLDYNATTPLASNVKWEMEKVIGQALNPSSLHTHGRYAKSLIENARKSIAKALGIKLGLGEYQITFTSSGTEANNLLLHNFASKKVIASSVEHLSILQGMEESSVRTVISVDSQGQVNMEHLLHLLESSPKGSLVSIIMANNETGIIQQNMESIVNLAHEYGMFVHSDFVQGFGKISMSLPRIDFITISSHKIGGPIGAAALVYKTNFPIKAHIIGGGQERAVRSGTENVPAIVGFGKAAELVGANLQKYTRITALRDKMESMIEKICPNAVFYGRNTLRLPNTSLILMPGVDAQKQLIQFDLHGISVSAGSACSSGKMKTSHVLVSMGVTEQDAKCTIRVSLGVETVEQEVDCFVEIWEKIFKGK